MLPQQPLHYRSIGMAAIAVAGLPLAWNIAARNEYRRHTIERALGGRKRLGAYVMAAAIFVASGARDALFQWALARNGPAVWPIVAESSTGAVTALKAAGTALLVFGSTLVLTSFLRLGITGTYLGDYFGILMKERVTAFPFSCFENPMYLGATANFLGAALIGNAAVGVPLTAWIAAVYHITTTYYENPFTTMIYSNAASKDAAAAQ